MGGTLSSMSMGSNLVVILIYLAVMIFYIYATWKLFEKAGYPGVGAIIPIFNLYILFKMANYSGWMIFLLFIPVVNMIIVFLVYLRISKGFGKGIVFALGFIFLSPIFLPILALGDADYDVSRIE